MSQCMYCSFCGTPMEKVTAWYQTRRLVLLQDNTKAMLRVHVPICQLCIEQSSEELSQRYTDATWEGRK